MAAPFITKTRLFINLTCKNTKALTLSRSPNLNFSRNFSKAKSADSTPQLLSTLLKPKFGIAALILGGGGIYLFKTFQKVYASDGSDNKLAERLAHKPSRQVRVDTDASGLKLTIYQYQTCPFCCKTRAFLDYHGFSYDVVEVNSVTKKQLKWSDYRKVPILMVEGQEGEEGIALRDSTVIISILESYLQDKTVNIEKINSYFPCIEEKTGKKIKYEFPNKYFVMYQEKADLDSTAKQRQEEREWREWTDAHMVHMLSPNAYRTIKESFQSFQYFSEVGEWEKNFSYLERKVVIYAGATVMYILGKVLKKRYSLKEDVRESLYDACNEWVDAVGRNRPFMGGDQPNLADLSVYGVLNSIEGCDAFQDALINSRIKPWYNRTKQAVSKHHGTNPLNAKTLASKYQKAGKDVEQTLSKA